MSYIEYCLFRVKFIRPSQRSFFHDDLTPGQLLLNAIRERPSAARRSRIWHIGNIETFSEQTGYFAVGRTTKTTNAKYDEESGNFVEEDFETSPYTHCVYDAHVGFLGIAKNSRLARSANGIASRIEELLSLTDAVITNDVSVEIAAISDPDGFLKAIKRAYRVTRFTGTFTGPNPFDADEHFQKPLSVYCREANGVKGKAQIDGDNLNKEVLNDVARSCAATGNTASARIHKAKAQPAITISLEGDPVKRKYAEEKHDPGIVVKELSEVYQRIRSHEGN